MRFYCKRKSNIQTPLSIWFHIRITKIQVQLPMRYRNSVEFCHRFLGSLHNVYCHLPERRFLCKGRYREAVLDRFGTSYCNSSLMSLCWNDSIYLYLQFIDLSFILWSSYFYFLSFRISFVNAQRTQASSKQWVRGVCVQMSLNCHFATIVFWFSCYQNMQCLFKYLLRSKYKQSSLNCHVSGF